jgi:hypothetical protein
MLYHCQYIIPLLKDDTLLQTNNTIKIESFHTKQYDNIQLIDPSNTQSLTKLESKLLTDNYKIIPTPIQTYATNVNTSIKIKCAITAPDILFKQKLGNNDKIKTHNKNNKQIIIRTLNDGKRYNKWELKQLINIFNQTPYPNYSIILKLAKKLDRNIPAINAWFRQKRFKNKKTKKLTLEQKT